MTLRPPISLAAVALMASLAATALAAEPTIGNVNLRGLQIGVATTITFDGDNLAPEPRLLLPFDATVQMREGTTGMRVSFDVTPGETTTPGVYNVWLATDGGVTAPVVIAVDRLPQTAFASEIRSLPAALHGLLGGSSVLETKFTGAAGQEILVEVEAKRIGSALRPVLHLYDANRLQLAWSWPTPALFGDTRLVAKLPADGAYTVALHDVEYAGPAPNHFRLKLGSWSYADQAYPPTVERYKTTSVELFGGGSLGSVNVAPTKHDICVPAAWIDAAASAGPRPFVRVSDIPELVEQASTGGVLALPAAPVAVSGRLSAAGEEDRYRLPVAPGHKYQFEVFGERLGSPLDPVLVILNDTEQPGPLKRGEDGTETTDPILELEPIEGVTSVLLAVSDLHRRGGPSCIYRIVVEQVAPPVGPADFRLSTPANRFHVSRSSPTVVPVFVERKNYDGPLRLTFDGLPSEMAVTGNEIPAGAEGMLATITTTGETASATLVAIRGESADGAVTRMAAFQDHPLKSIQPWLAAELAASVVAPTSFGLEWADSSEASLVLAGKLPLPIKLSRPEGEASPVRLSLVTSQKPPLVNGRPDVNKSLRLEAPIEVAPDKSDAQPLVLTPPDLPGGVYDLTIQAEMLSQDKRRVLATAFAPVQRLAAINPIGIQLAASPTPATLDPKTGVTVQLAGKVERRAGFAGDVSVQLAGLPPGVRADTVTVKADATDFELSVIFPANFQPRAVAGLKLAATGSPDPQNANVKVRSKEVDVTIAIIAAPVASGE